MLMKLTFLSFHGNDILFIVILLAYDTCACVHDFEFIATIPSSEHPRRIYIANQMVTKVLRL